MAGDPDAMLMMQALRNQIAATLGVDPASITITCAYGTHQHLLSTVS